MKKVIYWIGFIVIAVALVAIGIVWTNKAKGSDKLAELFPVDTSVYTNIHELGQWMPADVKSGDQTDKIVTDRGVDPMLQVLGQVWAATPAKPLSLPELLSHQPASAGLWGCSTEKPYMHGVAVVKLEPGQAEPLKKFMIKKLGEGDSAGKAGNIDLHLVNPCKDKDDDVPFDNIVWGVSEKLGILATSPADARIVIKRKKENLTDNPSYRKVASNLKSDSGALLFADLKVLQKIEDELKQIRHKNNKTMRVAEEKIPEANGNEIKIIGDEDTKIPLGLGIQDELKQKFAKLMGLDNLEALGLWTLPPAKEGEGWQARGWLGLSKPSTGIWKIVTSGVQVYQSLDNKVPRNGNMYVWSGGKDPSTIYAMTMEELKKNIPAEQFGWIRGGIGFAEGKIGLSFSNDLAPTLGDESCFVMGPGEKDKSFGFFLSLRDGRRFADLVGNNIAPQLHMNRTEEKGAEIWSSDFLKNEKYNPVLVISGDTAIFTNNPNWALSVEGDSSKAFEKFENIDTKASGIVVAAPKLWNKANDTMTTVVWHDSPSGISFEAVFPGHSPSWHLKDSKEDDSKKEQKIN